MSILKIKDSQGNWVGVPTVKGDTGNGISSAILNNDYTLTLTFTDGTTYTTPSIRGEKGEKGEPATDMDIHICSASEYDSETRIPTITSPDDKTFYLVPTEDGTSPDLFTEWVYVNGAWEMFGSASVDLSGYLTDVQINGTSIVTDGVANVPMADDSNLGAVTVNGSYGIGRFGTNGALYINVPTSAYIKSGVNNYCPIVPKVQHESVFYGLAKASGDTTQSVSSNPVGTYTDEAKANIQTMLGVPNSDDVVKDVRVNGTSVLNNGIGNIPIAHTARYGAMKAATADEAKAGAAAGIAVSTYGQHNSVFYGLAKSAGDTTQSASSNAVGSYTEDAKSKIYEMLGGSVSVSGTTPTIVAKSGIRYVCGEVATLDFTPSATGICDVVFTSGATATVLTVPSTVKWANGFDPTALEANTTYEINVMDGLGVAVGWA